MGPVDCDLNTFTVGQVTDLFDGEKLARKINRMRDQDQSRFISYTPFKGGYEFIHGAGWNRDGNSLNEDTIPCFAAIQRANQ